MNIGQAAKAAGISAKMIRYYESIGLVPEVGRTHGGYRSYDNANVDRLKFIRRARELGFSSERVRALLDLWSDPSRRCSDVKGLALKHIAELEERATEIGQMIQTLRYLADNCDGNDRPDCPIIEQLESGCASCGAPLQSARPTRSRK